jgi:hypothetical protein
VNATFSAVTYGTSGAIQPERTGSNIFWRTAFRFKYFLENGVPVQIFFGERRSGSFWQNLYYIDNFMSISKTFCKIVDSCVPLQYSFE